MIAGPDADCVVELQSEVAALRARLADSERDTDRTLLRATRLAQIVTALAEIGPAGRIGRVAGEVAELFSADVGLLLLGDSPPAVTIASRWGVPGDALPDGPHRIPDVIAGASDPVVAGPVAEVPPLAGLAYLSVRHAAWITLRAQDRPMGYLLLARRAPLPFTNADAHELRAVGARVALAVENAELQRTAEEQIQQLRVMHGLSTALAGTVDLGHGAQLVARTIHEVAPAATVALYRWRSGAWERVALAGEEDLPSRLDASRELPGAELLTLRDGATDVAIIALRHMPATGFARDLVGHLRDVAGLALGKMLLHERATFQARHDSLTGLPNRVSLVGRIESALRRRTGVAVIFLDLDRFKLINDSLGHDVGDQLLVQTADRLRMAVRAPDMVARLGGDEFVVLCEDLDAQQQAQQMAERIAEAMAAPFLVEGSTLRVTTSQGLAIAGPDSTVQTLLRDADAAMYLAKSRGRDRYEVFSDELRVLVKAQMITEQRAREVAARA